LHRVQFDLDEHLPIARHQLAPVETALVPLLAPQ